MSHAGGQRQYTQQYKLAWLGWKWNSNVTAVVA